jgi:CBS domain-containing protein
LFSNINNTFLRFEELALLEPQYADVYDACYDAFPILQKFRTEEGFTSNSSGRYLDFNKSSKMDKLKLKNAFQPTPEVQEILKLDCNSLTLHK